MSNKQLSPHFHRREFRCPCGCGGDTVDAEMLELLEAIRERFGPTLVRSGYRCKSHNRDVKGAPNSYHTKGQAADIQPQLVTAYEVAAWVSATYPDRYGVIAYPAHLHVDVRDTPYRANSEYR